LFEYADYEARVEMGVAVPHGMMDDAHISLVHTAIRTVAYVCDGAKDKDHVGYSQSDAYVGHALAEKDSLTANQATLGLRLIYRHRKQLPEWMWSVLEPMFCVNAGSR
jgi:hypothetical protein